MPIYQTPSDRAAEERLARRIEKAWTTLILVRQPDMFPVDYLAHNRETTRLVFAAEFKCRKCASNRYPDLILNTSKTWDVRSFAIWHGVPGLIVAGYGDGTARWTDLTRLPPGRIVTDLSGRRDPDNLDPDSTDHIPLLHELP